MIQSLDEVLGEIGKRANDARQSTNVVSWMERLDIYLNEVSDCKRHWAMYPLDWVTVFCFI